MTKKIDDPLLRQAIMWANPDFFSLSENEQEKYRVSIPEKDKFMIDQFLHKYLFGIDAKSEKKLEDAHDNLTDPQKNEFNKTILPLIGIGDDSFYLNEYLGDNTILDFDTLYDYDFDDFQFQEEERQKMDKNYERKPYAGNLYLNWARLVSNDNLVYGTLTMAAGYIHGRVDECGNLYIQELIPHEYEAGKSHGQKEKGGVRLDFQLQANGQEEQLDELLSRYHSHMSDLWRDLAVEYSQQSFGQAYMLNESQEEENIHFVFSDQTSLQAIRFRSFMNDCRNIESSPEALYDRIEAEVTLIKKYIDKQLADIRANYDPKVKKLRKKTEIIAHPDVASELL